MIKKSYRRLILIALITAIVPVFLVYVTLFILWIDNSWKVEKKITDFIEDNNLYCENYKLMKQDYDVSYVIKSFEERRSEDPFDKYRK